jgi:hypothetical protein
MGQIIGNREFVDGTRRPIYLDAKGQYVLDDDGERAYGVWLIPEEECYDLDTGCGDRGRPCGQRFRTYCRSYRT